MADRKTIRKEIENFKQETVEQYFVHTCGYDFVIDQINADVTFTGTKKECEFFIENNKLKKCFEEIHKDVQTSNHDYLILLEQKAQLENQIEKMKNCRNCKNDKIEGACGHFTQVGWCKNWELAD